MATEEILSAIPHRPPFLFVDEIVEQDKESMTTRRRFPETESFFAGHYPGDPIVPGVVLSEAVFQTGALFMARVLSEELSLEPGLLPVLTKITDAKFKSIVRPNDTVRIAVRYKEKMGRFVFMDGDIKTEDGRRVMNISFCVAMAKASKD